MAGWRSTNLACPLTVTEYGVLPGFGQHNGGDGLPREWQIDCPEAVLTVNLR